MIFVVEDAPGGFTARSLGDSIFVEADDEQILTEQIRDAILCHFEDEKDRPQIVRLHFVREQLLAV